MDKQKIDEVRGIIALADPEAAASLTDEDIVRLAAFIRAAVTKQDALTMLGGGDE